MRSARVRIQGIMLRHSAELFNGDYTRVWNLEDWLVVWMASLFWARDRD